MDVKKLRNDLFLIFALLLTAAVSLVTVMNHSLKNNLVARVSVQNVEVQVIDLSTVGDKDFYINGTKGILHIHTHEGAIAVLESNCPHQDCVHMGYVSETNRPIICAYNEVIISIDGNTINDVEI